MITTESGDFPPRVYFRNHYKKMRVPFVCYADFESILAPIASCDPELSDDKSYTKKYQSHEAISFSLYVVYSEGDYKDPIDYFGPDAAKMFVESIENVSKEVATLYSRDAAKPMRLTDDDRLAIAGASSCHICCRRFNKKDERALDHDHLSGRFRGVAHKVCNLNFRKPNFIPIFVHNLINYDTHLFIKMFGINNDDIRVVPNNEEKYISYEVVVPGGVNLRFLDSFRFMPSSLDSLVNNLNSDQFRHTSKYFSGDKLELVCKKGVYPYDYMDCIEKFDEAALPPKESFYNRLNKSNIEDSDYEHACKVWESFQIKNLKEYTALYNRTDTLLLADVIENFREVCMNTYKLDPAWYYTSPGLAWDAMLKITGVSLDQLTDYEMVLMITKGIRGGVSQCCHRYAKANNPYMHDYDPEKPNSYLLYLDQNNMYGFAMVSSLCYGNIRWLENTDNFDVHGVSDTSSTGYILEVDLEYPKELHDAHRDLPLAPELRSPPGSKTKKLLTTLYEKEKYVLHYRNLKLYLSLGMRLKKIHRVIMFDQGPWLKSYIDLNTDMRTKAANDFEKDFFKLMNNSVFGKTMENIRNRVDIRLATQDRQVEKWVARPNFKSSTIFTENLAAIHMSKTTCYFNKPIYVGMSVLDISKTCLYDFHYNVLKRKYGDRVRVEYTDTDSLNVVIETNDVYEDVKSMIEHFDTSDYKENNPYDMPRVNKKVLGKWKDELAGVVMRKFVGLRSKMYAYEDEKKKSGKKAKGVKKSVVKHELTFDDYKTCLFDSVDIYKTMNSIRSEGHNLYSIELHKKSLSAHDDKRFILENGIDTLPWGHFKVPIELVAELEIQAAGNID
ncbi:uncharacterized protein LOC128985297 [Macrosteles quadrilineatus]|uniref:uncharacterized protein LOC128985297 n=1 Tax=Macrosteles quadrilineatus TaxID=74068 RepID=UPI0023E0FB89|nr:uncharacterized protein LOC128985297 [Macrosteles quadrilineatus]